MKTKDCGHMDGSCNDNCVKSSAPTCPHGVPLDFPAQCNFCLAEKPEAPTASCSRPASEYGVHRAKPAKDAGAPQIFAGGALGKLVPLEAYEKLERELAGVRKDHADDWKRIQDAERELAEEKLRSIKHLEQFEADIRKSERTKSAALIVALRPIADEKMKVTDMHRRKAREALEKYKKS